MDSNQKKIFIDASSLKQISCWRKFYRNSILGLVHKDTIKSDYKMAFGSAFHIFIKNFYSGVPLKESIKEAEEYYAVYNEQIPETEWRTSYHLVSSCLHYANTFPDRNLDELKFDKNSEGVTLAEQTFAVPHWQNSNYVMILCGTIDGYGSWGGEKCIIDNKTTADQTDFYFFQYEWEIQMMFYSYMDNMIHRRGDKYLPVVINGIFLKKPTQKAAKEDIFDGCKIGRSGLISFTVEQMQEFEVWLFSNLTKVKIALENNLETLENSYNMAACKEMYGSFCKYFQICKASPSLQKQVLENYYVTKPYEPLLFGKK